MTGGSQGAAMTAPYQECPRYFGCNVNNCPLHPSYARLVVDEEDREQKCTLEKQVRFRIGSKYPDVLKWQGLTSREWTGKVRFESLPETERQVIRERAKERLSLACQSERIVSDTNFNEGEVR